MDKHWANLIIEPVHRRTGLTLASGAHSDQVRRVKEKRVGGKVSEAALDRRDREIGEAFCSRYHCHTHFSFL